MVSSAVIHICALLGYEIIYEEFLPLFHGGVILLGLPTILVAQKSCINGSKNFWDVVLKNCPPWIRTMNRALVFYGFIMFIIMWFKGIGDETVRDSGFSMNTLRGFSAVWMLGYCLHLAVFSSYLRSNLRLKRRCPNGHEIPRGMKTCLQCGQEVK